MKNYFLVLLMLALGFASCQDEPKKNAESEQTTEVADSLKILKGEFIYVDNAAVLKGTNFIYGVKIDSMAKGLAQQIDSLKRNEFDMVPVIIQGVVTSNPEEGWDEIVAIKKVLKVSEPVSDPAIRIESEE